MKKIIFTLTVALVVVSGMVYANREIKNEPSENSIPKPPTAAEKKAARKIWEATPAGVMYKKWEASPEGRKVYAGAAKIRTSIKDYTNMEGVVTSLSLPAGSRLGFGIMTRISGEDYILAFGPVNADKNSLNNNSEFKQLHNLKVNDKIIIKSHVVSYAPKYAYPIIAGDYLERDSKVIYKRTPRKGGC